MIATNGMFFHESAVKTATQERVVLWPSQARLDQEELKLPRK